MNNLCDHFFLTQGPAAGKTLQEKDRDNNCEISTW